MCVCFFVFFSFVIVLILIGCVLVLEVFLSLLVVLGLFFLMFIFIEEFVVVFEVVFDVMCVDVNDVIVNLLGGFVGGEKDVMGLIFVLNWYFGFV